MMSKTYVFEGAEVKKTGRTAIRNIAVVGRGARELKVVEITPVCEFEWKKWVNPDQLYEVISDENN